MKVKRTAVYVSRVRYKLAVLSCQVAAGNDDWFLSINWMSNKQIAEACFSNNHFFSRFIRDSDNFTHLASSCRLRCLELFLQVWHLCTASGGQRPVFHCWFYRSWNSVRYFGEVFCACATCHLPPKRQFPHGGRITAIDRVTREEVDREWSCGGYSVIGGCSVSGIRFTLDISDDTKGSRKEQVILHAWNQCKRFPYCGDPMAPEYLRLSFMRPIFVGNLSKFLTISAC